MTTFLNAHVESTNYMEQLEGYKIIPDNETRLVYHLSKALYGIRETPKAWNAFFTSCLVSYGFEHALVDARVFTTPFETLLYILTVYEDDLILVEKVGKFILQFKSDLAKRFNIEDLGPIYWLLAYNIE